MTDNLAVFFGYQRDNTIAGFAQSFYEFSFGRSTKGGRNDLADYFPVVFAFLADLNHHCALNARRVSTSISLMSVDYRNQTEGDRLLFRLEFQDEHGDVVTQFCALTEILNRLGQLRMKLDAAERGVLFESLA